MGKVMEQTANHNGIPTTLLEGTSSLADNLVQSEPFLRLQELEGKLHADQEAMRLLKEFSELQQKVRTQHNSSAIAESDIRRLRELQSIIGTDETIQDYELAKELAAKFLREVNQEISQLLGIDFASLTRRSGGCC